MATPVPIRNQSPPQQAAYSQRDWYVGPFGSSGELGSLTAANSFTHLLTLPTPNMGRSVVPNLNPHVELALKFWGSGAEDDTYTTRLWGFKRVWNTAAKDGSFELLGDCLGSATVTLGQATTHADSAIWRTTQRRWADVVTWSGDYAITPGIVQFAEVANGAIVSVLDTAPGYYAIVLECYLGGAATEAGYCYSV